MKYNKKELNKHMCSATFTMVITLVVMIFALISLDSLIICIFLPVCSVLFLYSVYSLAGISKAGKGEGIYLSCDDKYIIGYNLFGKEYCKILKNEVDKIYFSGDNLHVCVKTKRKIGIAEKIVFKLVEDRYYTYPIVLYSATDEKQSLSEYIGINVEEAGKETKKGELMALSRFLFIFIFAVSTFILTICLTGDSKYYVFGFIVSLVLLIADMYFNNARLYQSEALLRASLKSITIALFISQYLALGSIGTKVLEIERTGNVDGRLFAIYAIVILVSYCMCMFKINLVSLINRN